MNTAPRSIIRELDGIGVRDLGFDGSVDVPRLHRTCSPCAKFNISKVVPASRLAKRKKDILKFCKDCKWSEDLGGTVRHPTSNWGCSNEKVGSHIDIVDGLRIFVDCHAARTSNPDKPCGFEGRLWEPR